MRLRHLPTTLALAALFAVAAPATAGAQETLHYEWHLSGVVGRLAGLVLPSRGVGELRSKPAGQGAVVTELEITSAQAERGDYFLYGSEMTPAGITREAWSSYRWRDEDKAKRDRVDQSQVVDVAAGIQLVRREQPALVHWRIWSDGKIYPVVIRRLDNARIQVPAGEYPTVHYQIRGVDRPGERYWKGGIDLWLSRDEAATPVQIEVSRGWASVKLLLTGVERQGTPPALLVRR